MADDISKVIKELCEKSGIDFKCFIKEMETVLKVRIKEKLTPNVEWFSGGKNINRYWKYVENITGTRWTIDEINYWYSKLRSPSETRELISPSLRYEVLTRDKSTCQKCGRRAPEVRLEVDHKLPWDCGGPTVSDNLHTLCIDCNRGKSNKCF